MNCQFADVLRGHRLTTFEAIWNDLVGQTAKHVLPERSTARFELPDPVVAWAPDHASGVTEGLHDSTGDLRSIPSAGSGDPRTTKCFYIKRHAAAPWKEYVKPWLRLTRPILGARNEWEAILTFREMGIPTMTPVALGESGRRSCLITEAIPECLKLSQWMETQVNGAGDAEDGRFRQVVEEVAGIARAMHAAGLHHQDFYLTHLLLPNDYPRRPLYVIDLGRALQRRKLSRRWVVKDLAQLNYSARTVPQACREQFLESYLGRPLLPSDRSFMRRIERKTAAIARHSQKNRL